ncbi:MAG: glycosyltransferase family 4 protein [Pseudonocardiaceae bacterium]
MRVLVDGRVDGADGIGRYTRSVIAALRGSNSSDVEVTVLRPGSARRYSRAEGIELLSCAAGSRADLVHTLDYRVPVTPAVEITTIVTVHDVLRVVRPDLCYFDADFVIRFGKEGLADLSEVVADLREVAAFPVRRAPAGLHEEYLGRMLALGISRAECVITPTVTVARQLCDVVPAGDKLRVSSWGVDHLPSVTDLPRASVPGPYLLYVGQARPHKGLPALLAAVPRTVIYGEGASLALVGRDFESDSSAARMAVDALGAHRVLPLGVVPDAVLTALYAHATALVHLADHEGFGFPPLEALALGCPVVASDIPVLRETLGPHAAFADPGNPDDVADRVDHVVATDGPAVRAERIRWAQRFRWQRHVGDLLDCYRQLVLP